MADCTKLHIAMFPWLAFGHMIPYLELAKLIAQKGHKISFISTPRNVDRLPKLPPNVASSIQFVKLPQPQVENLPENAEATIDLPYEKPPSSFIDIQDDCKKPEDFTKPPKWVPFPSSVAFRLFEILRIFDSIAGEGSHTSDLYRFGKAIERSDAIAVRSCWEFETEYLNLLKELHQKAVIPVGLLPPTAYNNGNHDDEIWKPIKEWLDKQQPGSVVYVAFGSEAKPNNESIELPDGFEERTVGRGVVCTSWGPQLKILAHDLVGGFLSHAGWGSVVEAIELEESSYTVDVLG
ncbi:UDP-glucuronosyl/UDP-glucosyltransferase - like 10 [Theobroma cacao]|nr:UDP-glucuronosyl/UDP-glucosyltransferase - like 10 [Theobroma cacao]